MGVIVRGRQDRRDQIQDVHQQSSIFIMVRVLAMAIWGHSREQSLHNDKRFGSSDLRETVETHGSLHDHTSYIMAEWYYREMI